MDANLIHILSQLGIAAPLVLFMYLRQKRSDTQIDTKDGQILAASAALLELSKEVVKTVSEAKVAADTRDARIAALENRVSDLSRGKP